MRSSRPSTTTTGIRDRRRTSRPARARRLWLAALLAILVAGGAVLGDLLSSPASSTTSWLSTVASTVDVPLGEDLGLGGGGGNALGEADGAIPAGTSVFDDEVPGVAKLDPGLLRMLRRAAAEATGDGVAFLVDSGWRTPAYQEKLFRDAVKKYGSEAEAARWVASPGRSAHVSGNAIDIGGPGAAAWLSAHGAAYGLCQVYGNEPWHFELRPDATIRGCPPMYPDPTQDPRLQ